MRRVYVLALFALLQGCQKPGTDNSPHPTGPSTSEPAQPPVTTTNTPTTVQLVRVFQDGTTTGIVADISRLSPSGAPSFVARTDEAGNAVPNIRCGPSDRFVATPKVGSYYDIDARICASKLTFPLSSIRSVESLTVLANKALANNDFKSAQAYYKSASVRVRISDPKAAAELDAKANLAAARSFGIGSSGLVLEHSPAKQSAYQQKIEDFQRSHQLAPTGTLDVDTSNKLGETDQATLITNAHRLTGDGR